MSSERHAVQLVRCFTPNAALTALRSADKSLLLRRCYCADESLANVLRQQAQAVVLPVLALEANVACLIESVHLFT